MYHTIPYPTAPHRAAPQPWHMHRSLLHGMVPVRDATLLYDLLPRFTGMSANDVMIPLHISSRQLFAKNMEKAVIDTVEAGHMTKDLAICVHGWNVTEDQYLMTEPFMDEIKVGRSGLCLFVGLVAVCW